MAAQTVESDSELAYRLQLEEAMAASLAFQPSSSTSSFQTLENCLICLDHKSMDHFFSVKGCTHRYCYSCMKQHVEVKLLNGVLPKCPHEGCGIDLRVENCDNFLNPAFTEMMRQRVKEESIPVTEKVYCPYPKCSTLMSKTEVLINEIGGVTCYKCHGNFCINCRVPWHNDMNCAEYKRRNPEQLVEESKVKSMAARNMWRQCIKCKHMIELAAGCYHITCRCGYEFCYMCGMEWKNKKATCTCPLWDEEYIVENVEHEGGGDVQHDVGLAGDDFEHDGFNNDVFEGDDFGHDVAFEGDDFGHDVGFEGEDLEHDVGFEREDIEHDVGFEREDIEHDFGLEGDDFEQDVGPEGDNFEHDAVEDVSFQNDDFEDEDADNGANDEFW